MSPISSRKSVPLSACSKRPWLRWLAPVKAPFSWPKSSLSIRSRGIAAMLMATNGPLRRRPKSCSARATSSLPVPLSPVMSTVRSVFHQARKHAIDILHRARTANERDFLLRGLGRGGLGCGGAVSRASVPANARQQCGSAGRDRRASADIHKRRARKRGSLS